MSHVDSTSISSSPRDLALPGGCHKENILSYEDHIKLFVQTVFKQNIQDGMKYNQVREKVRQQEVVKHLCWGHRPLLTARRDHHRAFPHRAVPTQPPAWWPWSLEEASL